MDNLRVIWQPAWYELDQPIKIGMKGFFRFIQEDNLIKFYNGLNGDKYTEDISGEITSIKHKLLGDVAEINTRGFVYKFLLLSGEEIHIEAEETPGKIEYTSFDFPSEIDDFNFEVEIKIAKPI